MAQTTLRERAHRDEILRRDAHYAACAGSSRSFKRRVRRHEEGLAVVASTVAEVEAALRARARAEAELESALRRLPAGNERQLGVSACIREDVPKAEVARLLGVSRQRVAQLLADHADCPF